MIAVIEIGGKQYLVSEGEKLSVERLSTPEGKVVVLESVLFLNEGTKSVVGQPHVQGAAVEAKVIRHYKGKKIRVLKFKPKVRYLRRYGHRQSLSEIQITRVKRGDS